MQIDLINDIRKNLLEFLNEIDNNFVKEAQEKQLSLNVIFCKYRFYLKRHIPIGKRKVKVSSSLHCPKNLQPFFDEFKKKVENGEDLNPYLSKATQNLNAEDKLLSYWKIHHFHLGELKEESDFSQRSGPLLFVRFYAETAFFIDIKEHGCWNDISLLKIVCREFQTSMEQYKARGINDLYGTKESLTSRDSIKHIRNANINTAIKIDDVIYLQPAVTANGTDFESLILADKSYMFIKSLEKLILEEEKWLKEKFFWANDIVITTNFCDERFAFIVNIKVENVTIAQVNFADGLYSMNCGKYRFNNLKMD